MKKVVLLAFVLVLLLTALSFCVVGLLRLQRVYASPYTDISVGTAYNMITSGLYPDLVVLDVRWQYEYDSGHIYGAVWIPYTELDARIGELTGHENHEIIVYCRSGGRSATASGTLDSHGFTKVYNMLGGIQAWKAAGYPAWNATVHNVNTTFNYDTIQAAIDVPQTSDGHTILVDAGIYYEHVVVNKEVSLIGENKYSTIIDGSGTGTVIEVYLADQVNVTGFTIQNGTYGIFIDAVNTNISNNIIKNNIDGISGYLLYSTVSNNAIFSNRGYGIYLGWWSSGNTISGNNVSNNGYGIYLYTPFPRHTLRNNNINNNTYNFGVCPAPDAPIWPTSWSYDIDASNTVDGKPIYWWVNQQNKEIPSDSGYVGVVNSTNITVRDLNLTKNVQGVFFSNTNNSIITNVSISNNEYGIVLGYLSHNNSIFHNNFINNIEQARCYAFHVWDDGYPSGGNYWSNQYHGDCADHLNGPGQNISGSDGIADNPYVINDDNRDRYPLMKPYGGPHDIGIVNVTTSKTLVVQGQNLSINVKIVNYGVNSETFNVTAYANTTIIQTKTITLTNRNSTTITLTGNTTGFAKGNYTIKAVASIVKNETDTADNTYIDGLVKLIVQAHDIAITNVMPYKTVVGKGYNVSVSVTAENWGNYTETFNATAYYNPGNATGIPIETQTGGLTIGGSTTVTFTWNTTGVPYGNYTISANATPLPNETDTTDNTKTDGWVLVTVVGDVNGNGNVSVADMVEVDIALETQPGEPNYNPNADVSDNGRISVADMVLIDIHLGETW